MTTLSDLWKTFRFLTDQEAIPQDKKTFLHEFLMEEYRQRENRRIEYLMKMSGIKRTKLLSDFDWKFNPKVPRDRPHSIAVHIAGRSSTGIQPRR